MATPVPPAAPAKPDPGAAGNRRLQGLFLDLAERLQPEVFLDIGANDGAASLAMRLRLPACEIHAFEANPQIQARHAPRLQAARIQSWNLAAAAEAGQVTIYVPLTLSRAYMQGEVVPAVIQESEETGKASLLLRDEDATYREVQVEAVTVDGFVAEHLGPARGRRLLLWIDVEGAADRVLAGAGATLDQAVAAMVEVEGFAFWKAQSDRGAVVRADAAAWLRAIGAGPRIRRPPAQRAVRASHRAGPVAAAAYRRRLGYSAWTGRPARRCWAAWMATSPC